MLLGAGEGHFAITVAVFSSLTDRAPLRVQLRGGARRRDRILEEPWMTERPKTGILTCIGPPESDQYAMVFAAVGTCHQSEPVQLGKVPVCVLVHGRT
jgi:hypothetical protein